MIFEPCKSVFVSEYYKDVNFHKSNGTLHIGRFQGVGDSYRSLMRFDLSKLANDDFDKAYLIIDINRNEISQGSSPVGIYPILQDWNEKDITWGSALAKAKVPELAFTVVFGWIGLLIVDLTQLVHRWLDYTYPNYGIVLVGDETLDSLISVNNPAPISADRGPYILTGKNNVENLIEDGIKE